MNLVVDSDCPPDKIYMWSQKQGIRYNTSGSVAWEASVEERKHASNQHWGLTGWRPIDSHNAPVIWQPTGSIMTTDSFGNLLSPSEEDGWQHLLENAMSGDEIAYKAFKLVVESNPNYFEFAATLNALTK